MKCFLRSVLLFACAPLFSVSMLYGQSTEIYGLKTSNPNNPMNSPMDLVSMNPLTGQASPMFSIQNSNSVALGSSTFDHGQKRFIYWGMNTSGQSHYYSVGTQDSTTISAPIVGTGFPIELEYDLQFDSLYGLTYDQATSTEYFVSVDLASGSLNQLSSIPGVQAVVMGNSAYNSNTGRYAFHGGDQNTFRQYILDAHSGQVVHSPILSNSGFLRGIQYDLNTNQLFTLLAEYDSSMYDPMFLTYYQKVYLAEIDTLTAAVTKVSTTPVLEGFLTGIILGSVDFDQANRQMAFLGSDENTDFRLIMVDVTTGLVTIDVPTSDYLLEMEIDNQAFAKTKYEESNPPIFVGEWIEYTNIKMYPNPAQARIQLELSNPTSHLKQVELWDMQGRLLQDISYDQRISHRQEMSIESLSPGFYVVKAWDQQGNAYRASLLKE